MRQKEYKIAALKAKQQGNLEKAKEYMKTGKVCTCEILGKSCVKRTCAVLTHHAYAFVECQVFIATASESWTC